MTGVPEEYFDVFVRIFVASLLGGLVGLERDIHGREAGLRTHLLVSMGAGVFMVLSELVSLRSLGSGVPADSGRIAAQVVAGIGFLGAGVIIKSGITIRGLTTAASLWTTAAIGMAAGGGYFWIAGITMVFALISLIGIRPLERLYSKDSYRLLSVTTPINIELGQIIDVIKSPNLKILNCDIHRNYDMGFSITKLSLRLFHRGVIDKQAHSIIKSLETSSLVLKEVRWDHS